MDRQEGYSQHPSGSSSSSSSSSSGGAQRAYGSPSNPYQPSQITAPPGMFVTPSGTIQPTGQPGGGADQLGLHQLAYQQHIHQQQLQQQQLHQQQQQQLQQQLQAFWADQRQEIEHVTDFKKSSFPLARIRTIVKADEDVKMIAAEVPILFAKACEMFTSELTLRSWNNAVEDNRTKIHKNDIVKAVNAVDLAFLLDHLDAPQDQVLPSMPAAGSHYAFQVGTAAAAAGTMRNPVMAPNIYAHQSHMLPQHGTDGVCSIGNPTNMYAQQSHMLPQHTPQVNKGGVRIGNPTNIYDQQSHPYKAQQMCPQPPEQQQSSPTTDILDLLDGIVSQDLIDEVLASFPIVAEPAAGPPYGCYLPPQHGGPQVGTAGGIMGNPVRDPNMHDQHSLIPSQHGGPQVGTDGVILGNPEMDPKMYDMPSQHAPQVGTDGVIPGNPVMDPNKRTKHSHPNMSEPPEKQQSSPDH